MRQPAKKGQQGCVGYMVELLRADECRKAVASRVEQFRYAARRTSGASIDNFLAWADSLLHMNSNVVLLLALGIGVIAGLRSLTAPAVTSWAACLGWLPVHNTPFHFMASKVAVAIFSLLALAEFVADQLPSTPSRTAPTGLIARIITGGLCGATIAAAGGQSWWIGAALGAVGGVLGAFGGYQVRARLVRALGVPDFVVATVEDIVAIGGGLFLVSRF